jgi:heme-degrading monooxygenase HmoA
MIVQIVRFKSMLSDEDVLNKYEERSVRYREIKGLLQKYYLKYRDTGEHGAVYVWKSEEDMQSFRQSELYLTIPDVYKVSGDSNFEVADVVLLLRS